jgi:hypothetical protein
LPGFLVVLGIGSFFSSVLLDHVGQKRCSDLVIVLGRKSETDELNSDDFNQ